MSAASFKRDRKKLLAILKARAPKKKSLALNHWYRDGGELFQISRLGRREAIALVYGSHFSARKLAREAIERKLESGAIIEVEL